MYLYQLTLNLKLIGLIFLTLVGIQTSWSQDYDVDIIISKEDAIKGLTLSLYTTDIFSKENYTNMVNSAEQMTTNVGLMMAYAKGVEAVVEEEHTSLTEMSTDFTLKRTLLTNFIYTSSMDYIELKYPIVPTTYGYVNGNAFGNIATRARFKVKLTTEKTNITSYLAADNPISEGERIYLILSAIENVIKTTLEYNEEL